MTSAQNLLRWQSLTLPGQFLLAGAGVMVLATLLVGFWVSRQIEHAVVQNSAISTALFMDSFVSPLSQELAKTDTLSPPARQALAEIFDGTSIGERVLSYKIWGENGLVIHASDPTVIGQVFEPSDDLRSAWQGEIAASFQDLNDIEDTAEAALGVPLLEVYSPIRQSWSGDVIAVAEFYEDANILAGDIADANRNSWLVVSGAFLASGVLLFGIVQTGGHTIRRQRTQLHEQLRHTEKVSAQNADLRRKAVAASARATAQTERAIRRIGSDLHDGPGQYLSLASLRLDSALGTGGTPSKDAPLVRKSLDMALDELRIISRGLALPDLDNLEIDALIDRAVTNHTRQTDLKIVVDRPGATDVALNYAQKLCVFRFLQESLSNISRHADVEQAAVTALTDDQQLCITVADTGRGFDATKPRTLRDDGGQGLFSLTDRAESIGGALDVASKPTGGTILTLTLPFEETTL